MLAKVKVLLEGFTSVDKHQPTVTLVVDGDMVIVVDPGVMESQQSLIDALKEEGLAVHDVNIVCITHSHLDHYRNIGMFPKAKTLEYFGLWDKNTSNDWPEHFTRNIQILRTPGHDYTSITLLVTTENGVVAICGDVFWKKNFPRSAHDDVYASNPEKLEESREVILKKADWVIPGHGPMYENNPDAVIFDDASIKIEEPKIIMNCKKCGREMKQKDKCRCRPFLCFRCCECALDCNRCACSHRVF